MLMYRIATEKDQGLPLVSSFETVLGGQIHTIQLAAATLPQWRDTLSHPSHLPGAR